LHTFLFIERPVAEYLLVDWKITFDKEDKNDVFRRIRISWNIRNENCVFFYYYKSHSEHQIIE
jgi:hypothetical protein